MKIIASLLLATVTLVSGFQQPLVENIGVTAPFNKKFDPLGFSENVPDIEVSRLRESELKHGRWAMISAASIPLLETHSSEPAIHAYDKLPHPTQFTIAALILMGEFRLCYAVMKIHSQRVRHMLSSFARIINQET